VDALDRLGDTYQLDERHLNAAFYNVFPDRPQMSRRLKVFLYQGQGNKSVPAVCLVRINTLGDFKRVENLLGYSGAIPLGSLSCSLAACNRIFP
jgi:hypothetical protein